MKVSKSPVVAELEVHRSVVHRLGVRQHDNHLFRAERECAFNRLRDVNLLRPLFGADRVAVKRVDDRVAMAPVAGVAGRQKDEDGPIDGVPFQIAFERRAVNRDALDGGGSRSRDNVRHRGLHLARSGTRRQQDDQGCHRPALRCLVEQCHAPMRDRQVRCPPNPEPRTPNPEPEPDGTDLNNRGAKSFSARRQVSHSCAVPGDSK